MSSRFGTVTSFLQPLIVVLYLVYPAIQGITQDYGSFSLWWTVGVLVLPVALGLSMGRYWVMALAISAAGWFFVDLARGRSYAVEDWHRHTAYEIVALVLYVVIIAALIAFGVWLRRRFARPLGHDWVADKVTARRAQFAPRSRLTTRDLRWCIAGALALFGGSLLTTGIAARLLIGASLATYFGGWFYLHRQATKASSN